MKRLLVLSLALLTLAGCGADATAASDTGVNTSAEQNRVTTTRNDAAAALLPAKVRDRGTLVVGAGFGSGSVPLGFYADDNKTPIGLEVDIAYLVAQALGLQPKIEVTSWENLFVGLDSAKYDVGFSNITVTEKRKQKYDFATYRKDDIAFEAKKGGTWRVTGAKDIAGKTIAVGSGTNQEKILVDWNEANVKAGLPAATIKYFQKNTDTYLALSSGRIDGYLGPNPSIAYHVKTSGETETIGKFSGAGPTLQGLIAATTKKDSGLVKAYQTAIDGVIADGSYAKVLDRWNVSTEAVAKSEINPPGLPLTS
ncbi:MULTISPECIES: ABC transporter substrate-binding protein [Kribbella]|uniref:Amino acid ABC transporter substrate-binding protein (PAAT family) n=1 Tax=Kribbella pratensis TaxID=2512112 RepID=A0ABY2FBJ3_9ACTN|nr:MULTISPECIES: ABC transporter substrate-binding protein [Kribbella]TDW87967.1 amino acid ABC transporter substrate-binding protein (PAAT family) [Kribbella pratensis]TDW88837.1 amino acid ABC transporter substrate-binding protein (PAAT family) [Kribbella sp. VKM Ac-2566]